MEMNLLPIQTLVLYQCAPSVIRGDNPDSRVFIQYGLHYLLTDTAVTARDDDFFLVSQPLKKK